MAKEHIFKIGKIFFLIPVFNEEKNLTKLAENLFSTLPEKTKIYIFVNDGSTDNSARLIDNLFDGTNYIQLKNTVNQGPGFSFNYGFEYILSKADLNSDIIITMEADNTSDILLLPKMTQLSEMGFDLVLASIYVQGGGFDKTSFFRKFYSAISNLLLRYFFNIKVLTLSSFYRVYRAGLIGMIKEKYGTVINNSGFISMIELLIKSIRVNASIIEVPMVLHSQNRVDKSKMKKMKTIISYIKFFFSKL